MTSIHDAQAIGIWASMILIGICVAVVAVVAAWVWLVWHGWFA